MLFAAVHEPAIDVSRQFAALHQFGRFGAKRTFSEPRLQNWFRVHSLEIIEWLTP